MLSTHSFPARDISLSSFVEGRELLPAGNSPGKRKKKRNPNPYQHPSKIHSERRGGRKRGKKTLRNKPVRGRKNILMVMVCIYFLKNLFLSLHFATEMLILVKTIIGSWNHCLPTCTARARLKLCNQNQWCWISHLSPS